MKNRLIILVSLIFLFSNFSYSQRYKGSQLIQGLKEYEKKESGARGNWWEIGCFLGYILGTADAGDGHLFSLPSGSTNEQVVAVVAKYLNENPERWNESAFDLVKTALIEAFPLNVLKKNMYLK